MSKPREWPNNAAEARNKSAEEAIKGAKALRFLVHEERPVTEVERLRREAIALDCLENILQWMAISGAPIRPE